jgi:hypothetical protein
MTDFPMRGSPVFKKKAAKKNLQKKGLIKGKKRKKKRISSGPGLVELPE